jgi:signal transduction histidine kinase
MEDASFLLQAVEQILPVIENLRLIDRLVGDAADEERRKIARSVHDRVIQPYLGLQIGIKALQQELSRSPFRNGSSEAERSVTLLDELVAMTGEGVQELRQYVSGLRNPPAGETMLVDVIRRFSTRFEGVTGIRVDVVDNSCGLTMKDWLAAEVFQMTAEALSNIQRHTHARKVEVRLSRTESNLELSVENDSNEVPSQFRPKSILERAEALGARTEVLWPSGKTLVRVEVPL